MKNSSHLKVYVNVFEGMNMFHRSSELYGMKVVQFGLC